MGYRKEASHLARETRWTFFRFLPIAITAIVVFSVLGFGLNSLGVFGKVFVERKAFEQSYQKSEGLKSEVAMNEAVIAQIEAQLRNPNIDENTRYSLNAQLAAAKLRLSTAYRKQ